MNDFIFYFKLGLYHVLDIKAYDHILFLIVLAVVYQFKQWKKVCLDFYNNSYGVEIVAVKDGQYIGSTYLAVYSKSEPKKAWTDNLGVIKEFRRMGLATALKIRAIESLLNKGITEIRTDNEKNNPMYKINEALGFKSVPFSLDYMKEL